jgi:hypothetical protein
MTGSPLGQHRRGGGQLVDPTKCTEVSHGIDKWLWFVEAHLQAKR